MRKVVKMTDPIGIMDTHLGIPPRATLSILYMTGEEGLADYIVEQSGLQASPELVAGARRMARRVREQMERDAAELKSRE